MSASAGNRADTARRVLVFAHTPPPHHGQSAMVRLMLDLLQPPTASDPDAPRLFHVNARVSREAAEVGGFRAGKVLTLLGHCLHAIRLRWQHGARVFYYVPAPPARTPVWRDLMVMTLCRPFFPRLVLHWHAGGLADWLEQHATPWEQRLTRRLLRRHHLSIVLRPFHRRDADFFEARQVTVIPNGLPDPCPDFERNLKPRRSEAAGARLTALSHRASQTRVVVRVLFMSWLRREKGLFDALDAVALANAQLRDTPLRLELTVAGDFASAGVRSEFERRVAAPDLAGPPPLVRLAGFVSGAAKDRLLRESDCLCFPTLLPEGFPLTLAEAMAYGLPVVISDFRQLPEILPPGYPGVFAAGQPADLAAKLVEFARRDYDPALRPWFLEHYTAERFAVRMRAALSAV